MPEHQKKEVQDNRGQERLRDTCDVECKTLGRTQAKYWRVLEDRQREESAVDVGTTRQVDFQSDRMYYGATVWK